MHAPTFNDVPRHAADATAARRPGAGFTLLEMLVSIALVLILVLGVNSVFRIASDSVGAGQALSDTTRSNRAIQTVLYNDFQQSIISSVDCPAFIIRSGVRSAFLDREDELSDRDYVQGLARAATDLAVRSVDLNGDNSEAGAGETINRNNLSQRNHRTDLMSFFARYLYPRQTGNEGVYAADMGSNEAWIWYGIVRQPRDLEGSATTSAEPGWDTGAAPMVPSPGTATTNNPNNFYARQFGLGRTAILLRERDATTNQIVDRGGVPQFYHWRPTGTVVTSTRPLDPQGGATSNTTTTYPGIGMADSRFDLADTSIDAFRRLLVSPTAPATSVIRTGPGLWYDGLHMGFRFQAYPLPTYPLSSYGAARTVPWLVGGCTQFIVEYAGDFLNQDAAGATLNDYTGGATDGQTDYVLIGAGPAAQRVTRWYGFPRDVSGPNGVPDGLFGVLDVRPLRDSMIGGAIPAHEHFIGSTLPPANYANPALAAEYVAAWAPIYPNPADPTNPGADLPAPPKPAMIRVTMTIDDQQGRLPQGQTYEYVIELP